MTTKIELAHVPGDEDPLLMFLKSLRAHTQSVQVEVYTQVVADLRDIRSRIPEDADRSLSVLDSFLDDYEAKCDAYAPDYVSPEELFEGLQGKMKDYADAALSGEVKRFRERAESLGIKDAQDARLPALADDLLAKGRQEAAAKHREEAQALRDFAHKAGITNSQSLRLDPLGRALFAKAQDDVSRTHREERSKAREVVAKAIGCSPYELNALSVTQLVWKLRDHYLSENGDLQEQTQIISGLAAQALGREKCPTDPVKVRESVGALATAYAGAVARRKRVEGRLSETHATIESLQEKRDEQEPFLLKPDSAAFDMLVETACGYCESSVFTSTAFNLAMQEHLRTSDELVPVDTAWIEGFLEGSGEVDSEGPGKWTHTAIGYSPAVPEPQPEPTAPRADPLRWALKGLLGLPTEARDHNLLYALGNALRGSQGPERTDR